MKKLPLISSIVVLVLAMLALTFAQGEKTIHKEFDAKKNLDISIVSGDCFIESGAADKIIVDIEYFVKPEKAFKPRFTENSNTLKIKEKWSGSSSGRVKWFITVPKDIEIDFSAASGDLEIDGTSGSIEASTASGDISIRNTTGDLDISTASGDIDGKEISGELELSTASGDIELDKVKGSFDLSCASGDIDISDAEVEDMSDFSTASGDVEVSLAASPKDDIEISAASGDVALDYNRNKMEGYFEVTVRKGKGRIKSDVGFDKVEEVERHGRTRIRKSFKAGSSAVNVSLSSASGTATLKK